MSDWKDDLRPAYRGELIADLESDDGKLTLDLEELDLIPDAEIREEVKKLIIKGHQRFYSRSFNPALFLYRKAFLLVESLPLENIMRLTIQIYLADTYLELFNFENAKGELLKVLEQSLTDNRPISPRVLWLKMAKTWLAAGDALYRGISGTLSSEQKELIRNEYNQILEDGVNPNFSSPLYSSSLEFMFSDVESVVRAIQEEDASRLSESHPQMVELICKCQQRFKQLDQNSNFIGFSSSYVPILRFDYLQDIARRFAQTAAQANREYISYMQKAQQESFTFRQMQQAVELNEAGVAMEQQALESSRKEIASARSLQELADTRWRQAKEYENYYRETGRDIVRLDEALSWANAGTVSDDDEIRLRYGGLEDIGIANEYQLRSTLIQKLTTARATRNFNLQLEQLQNRVTELAASRNVSRGQLNVAISRDEVAQLRYRAAQFRLRHSEANLEEIRSREIDLEFFSEIARLVRDTAQTYLEHATLLAYMMQQAYNFEFGENLNRIRLDYGDLDDLQGLYAADLLLRDIDFFTFHKAVQIRNKIQPVVTRIELRKRYPLEFLKLQQDGEMLFSTKLEYFHQKYPGIYNARIINVSISPITGERPIGSLTANGVSYFRNIEGEKSTKMHASETLLISDYKSRTDMIIAPTPNEQLVTFENIGLETDWLLSFPKSQNLINYSTITDVYMTITFYCEVDSKLAEEDLNSIPQSEEIETYFAFKERSTRFENSFADLQDFGEYIFEIEEAYIPHPNPRIRGLRLIAVDENNDFIALNARLWSQEYGSEENLYESNENKIVVIQSEEQEDGFRDTSLVTKWTIVLRPEDNPDLISSNDTDQQLDLSNFKAIFLVVRYFYSGA
ncbi:hypothetical protein SPB21_01475 [Leptothoe sp. ISB3NOV94-8A]